METRARYVLIGLFTLAVVVAGFAFVYWLETTGGLTKRTPYVIRFQSSVSGLLPGSAVLFNGIRVGEVTSLALVPDDPRQVEAAISIDAATPVRTDTEVSLDFQGLTGVPVVILNGGTSNPPASAGNRPPILFADKSAGQTMSNAARQVLGRIDKVLEDNSDSLHSMLTNLDNFSKALGRNSDRVDSILTGLERMTGGSGKASGVVFELAALQTISPPLKPLTKQLAIADPSALLIYDSEKLVTQGEGGALSSSPTAKWADVLPKLIQARVIQSFDNNGGLGQVSRFTEGTPAEFQLTLDVRRFQIVPGPEPMAEAELAAKLLSADGRIVAARVFQASAPAKNADGPEAAGALGTAFGTILSAMIPWTANAVAGEKDLPSAFVAPDRRANHPEKTR
jgi:phospholipid/cholesterol/gamma-HCH transport system substrate-binding protein